ncbi:MAG: methyl-accepting chemotaxis protein [Oleispira sp.]|nr:methyl-accepting chemotaxis protein [Oleispira sp.]
MNLKVKQQLIIAFIAISAVSILISSILIGNSAISESEMAIKHQVEQKLIAARDLKKSQIEDYFKLIDNQIKVASSAPWIIDAADYMTAAFFDYPLQTGGKIEISAIKNYYNREFNRVYKENNDGSSANVDSLLAGISDNALFLQQDYIALNSHPLGSKDSLIKLNNNSAYDLLHQEYHPTLRKYLQTYGFYDIFIVEPDSGHIIYSVFKELDFATSLTTGPYSNSGLGQAFKQGMELQNIDDTVLIDFAPYLPSYDAAASFIASPIMRDGERLGILIYQMPIDGINDIMTNKESWKETGFGESGETYLVGSDNLLRSQSRFLIEDKAGYLTAMSSLTDKSTLAKIEATDSAVGLQKVDNLSTKGAASGTSGIAYIQDYRNEPVISAYTPINVLGYSWSLLSEIDQKEAFSHLEELVDSIIFTTVITSIVLIIIMAGLGTLFTRIVVRPIESFSDKVTQITSQQDLSIRIPTQGNTEFSALGIALNSMLDSLATFTGNMRESAENLAKNSTQLNEASANAAEQVNQQNLEVNAAATATTELSASINEVAQSAEQAANQMRITRDQVNISMKVANETQADIYQLQENMNAAISAMAQLETESQGIGAVLDVIQNIAEQTNLLALNAAIEAARAGEQGRGFAVVADEVRTLASRTATSTDEIRSKIDSLQKGVENALTSVQASQKNTQSSIEKVESTVSSLQKVTGYVDEADQMNAHIATAAEEQSQVTEEINRNVLLIKDLSDNVLELATSITASSNNVSSVSIDIHKQVDQFKV